MKTTGLLIMVLTLLLGGCAHVMSEQSLRLVDRRITFEALRSAPESYIGRHVILGGTIAGVKNLKEGGELEVLQAPLDSSDTPKITQSSGGRFLVTTSRFLDPLVYKKDRRVTVVGEVKGKTTRLIDEHQYIYPVIAEVEMRLWEKYQPTTYGYPPPYFYDPFWDPWWPYYRRPFYPYGW